MEDEYRLGALINSDGRHDIEKLLLHMHRKELEREATVIHICYYIL
jgi:hypothetical protein